MKVVILGADGYLGFPLTLRLLERGDEVWGVDNLSKRSLGGKSAIPIASASDRVDAIYEQRYGDRFHWCYDDVTHVGFMSELLENIKPDAIFDFAEIASAPYSQQSVENAIHTQTNNITGTLNILFAMKKYCPDAHLIKLGTMGEYGTPDVDIPEGFFDAQYQGRSDWLPFPRQPGSFYHLSKVHDSFNIMLACKLWNLNSTDIMQGVIYGSSTPQMGDDPRLKTTFYFDAIWGTALNRFCAQAVAGFPITPYGTGGQKRGFISLCDAIRCYELILDNPIKGYRVINQFDEVYSIMELAEKVKQVAEKMSLGKVRIAPISNLRVESEKHYYNPRRDTLDALGYKRGIMLDYELQRIISDILPYRETIIENFDSIKPEVSWT